jgi:ribosomal protein L11 methyltransferase
MNNPTNQECSDFGVKSKSYEDLYIYYLEGRVFSTTGFFDHHFIGNWEEEGSSFLFFSKPSEELVLSFVENHGGLKLLDHYKMSYEEWQGGKFSSLQIGRFTIIPPWDADNADSVGPGDINKIFLDPGVVFGNGLHPTTRDCIEALELLFSIESIESALDLGCGTGILALVAGKLGCRKCFALDFNLLASQTASNNVKLNGLMHKIIVAQARAENFVDIPTDLLIANIHYDVMKKLLESEGFFKEKWFILSGLLRSQAKDIAGRLQRSGVKILKRWEREGIWHTYFGKIS